MNRKILAISNHGFMLGGGEHSFLDLLSHLQGPWNILAIVPEDGELRTRLQQKGIETQVSPLPPINPWRLFSIFSTLKAYFKLYRRYRPALIYANGSRAVFYGGIVGRILSLPVVWHCRISDVDPNLDPILTRLSSVIIANSQATSKRFKRPFQSKVKVVHNGVDIQWLRNVSVPKPKLVEDEWKVVLVVARVSRWKRHDLALAAFEQVAIKDQNVHLVCVGAQDSLETEWWDYLQNRSRQSKFSNRIHWVGQMEDVRPWYRAAFLLLLCSENEPFGRVLVEAMACGVPVIATRSGGIPEIVRHGKDGMLVEPGKSSEVIQAILEVLKDENKRRCFVSNARHQAELFSLETHIKRMEQVFEDLTRQQDRV